MFIFPVQLTTSRIGNLTRLIKCNDHTYIHTIDRTVLYCTADKSVQSVLIGLNLKYELCCCNLSFI